MLWLASSGTNVNPDDNANFGPDIVNEGDVGTCNNMFNSNGNSNYNGLAVRPVASINCGYIVIYYIRDNIETN